MWSAGNYMFKWRRSGVFIIDFEHSSISVVNFEQ